MDLSLRGSFQLFRAAGITVYMHWTWLLFAVWQISSRPNDYQAAAWKVAEYVALFAIVLLHEFGHALACRSVGGLAERIVLWPLGGVAYVAPPPRPGPVLWSIAAGPLVNVALLAPLFGLHALAQSRDWPQDFVTFLMWTKEGNFWLLVFNLLPIYPLDGGQILQSLLWFAIGRWKSLLIVSLIGMLLGGVLVVLSVGLFVLSGGEGGGVLMLGFIAVFIVLRSLASFQGARSVLALENLPRHSDFLCPVCAKAPPRGPFWVCEHCQTRFDLFDHDGHCPGCGAWYLQPTCPHCHQKEHIDRWRLGSGGGAP